MVDEAGEVTSLDACDCVPHPSKTAKGGAPSITVSALSRDTYPLEGFLVLLFPSWRLLVLVLLLFLLLLWILAH
jgi:hypothetical protein